MCIDELDDWRKAQSGVNMQETLERLIMQANLAQLDLTALLRLVRREYLLEVLKRCRGNQCAAGRILGRSRNSITRDMHELGIPRKRNGQRTT